MLEDIPDDYAVDGDELSSKGLIYGPLIRRFMAKKNDSGFQSSAGLMRYFDTENEKGVKIGPKTVIGIAIGLIVIVSLMNVVFPLN